MGAAKKMRLPIHEDCNRQEEPHPKHKIKGEGLETEWCGGIQKSAAVIIPSQQMIDQKQRDHDWQVLRNDAAALLNRIGFMDIKGEPVVLAPMVVWETMVDDFPSAWVTVKSIPCQGYDYHVIDVECGNVSMFIVSWHNGGQYQRLHLCASCSTINAVDIRFSHHEPVIQSIATEEYL